MHDDLAQYEIPAKYLPADPDYLGWDFGDNVAENMPLMNPDEAVEWASSRPSVSRWAETAKALRLSPGEWVHVDVGKASCRGFAANVKKGQYAAFDPTYFEARVDGGEVYMRFARPGGAK